ncbi:Stress responsive A/B Barrel Domain protein [compost metagenome]
MSTIKHLVIFTLYSGKDTTETELFLQKSKEELSVITGVEQFEVFRQVSDKNDFDYGFSMLFTNEQMYDAYNNNPTHIKYVEECWNKKVSRFQEIDLIVYQ